MGEHFVDVFAVGHRAQKLECLQPPILILAVEAISDQTAALHGKLGAELQQANDRRKTNRANVLVAAIQKCLKPMN
jgi:hypothetical protein